MTFSWNLPFLDPIPHHEDSSARKYALIILNQPFPFPLLHKLWQSSAWKCCADGGANRLHDTLKAEKVDLREQ